MALVYYETGIQFLGPEGHSDYLNVFVTQSEEEARRAYGKDRRNYLARLTMDDDGSHTEFWNRETSCWEPHDATTE
ncbi:MAG TPA: hypothetical protein IAA83_05105 [Candidatus Avoscillospira avistercoris]|uniref:Uncharacterized protein n=1 Tax=Candidatus Avoscillospira avistercoris TaxID=2840707 RepID=A0A9D1JSX2_9FIRM|nr:hypothetical protein [Candidatus Avoscillospira avistercoris]